MVLYEKELCHMESSGIGYIVLSCLPSTRREAGWRPQIAFQRLVPGRELLLLLLLLRAVVLGLTSS